MEPIQFFATYAADAKQAQIAKGIPASVTLAQAYLESGCGAYAFQNNFFGIKANTSWTGKKQLLRTTEVLPYDDAAELRAKTGIVFPEVLSIEPYGPTPGMFLWHVRDYFRAYDSAAEGFTDHANFFIVNSRYEEAIKDESNDEQFALDIAKAGYATAPNYGQALINVIREYNLTKYDN